MSQLIKFGLTGGVATALHYVVYALGLYIFGFSAGLSTAIGYFAGSVLSYVVNYKFTFKSNADHKTALTLFYIMVILAGTLNTLIVAFAADLSNIDPWVSQILATAVVFIVNFIVSRKWVFTNA